MNRWHDSDADWTQFQQSLFKQIPFIGRHPYGKNIEQFVQQTIKKMLPKALDGHEGLQTLFAGGFEYELFETHRSIFIRCRLDDPSSEDQVKLFVNRRKLKIDDGKQVEEIPLPSDVQTSRVTARLEDGILEIRLPKSADIEPFREIYIRKRGRWEGRR
jgi:hypothetical protein